MTIETYPRRSAKARSIPVTHTDAQDLDDIGVNIDLDDIDSVFDEDTCCNKTDGASHEDTCCHETDGAPCGEKGRFATFRGKNLNHAALMD